METRQWKDTADFTNATAQVTNAGRIAFRHRGCRYGEPWNTTDHPDTSAEVLSGWIFENVAGGANAVAFVDSRLQLTFGAESSADKRGHYWRPTKTNIAATSVFTAGFKLKRVTPSASYAPFCFGLFNATNSVHNANSIYLQVLVDGELDMYSYDEASSENSSLGSSGDLADNTDYWIKITGDGTNITAQVFGSEADYVAGTNVLKTRSLTAAACGPITANRVGFHSIPAAGGTQSEVWSIGWVDGSCSNWYPRHQGNYDGSGFNNLEFPDTTGETLEGWTVTNVSGNLSAVAYSNGAINFTLVRAAGTSAQFKFGRPTTSTLAKNSTFSATGKFRPTQANAAGGIAFFSSASARPGDVNCVLMVWNTTTVYLQIYDNAGTADADSQAYSLNTSTDYWFEYLADGTNITLKFYTSAADLAARTNAVVDLSVAVADISGTLALDRFGVVTKDNASVSQTLTVYWLNSPNCSWYTTPNTARLADTATLRGEYPSMIYYDTFDADVTGNVLFDIRKKETAEGEYTTYNNSGNHYTAAQIAALEYETLYGIGFDVILDVTDLTCAVDNVEMDYDDDEIAPEDLDYLTAMNPVTGMDQYAVRFLDPTDEGESGLKWLQMRISEDDGATFKYIGIDGSDFTLEDDVADAMSFRNPGHDREDVDYTGYLFGIDVSDLGITADSIKIWMRGIDGAGNEGGWTLADTYASESGSGDLTVGSVIIVKGGGRAIYQGGGLAVMT